MRWTGHLDPSAEALRALRGGMTRLVDCGVHWDAVIIAPLARGLAALDMLGLGLDDGHMVIADRNRQELAPVRGRSATTPRRAYGCCPPGRGCSSRMCTRGRGRRSG
jgi:hypothetical protein